jgi:hypothetical protein
MGHKPAIMSIDDSLPVARAYGGTLDPRSVDVDGELRD